jgi:type II secretory pathway component PulF
MLDNETVLITSTERMKTLYVKSHPFDSWYIGGLLFMLIVILVLLYANYYRENAFQILWNRLLLKLHLIPPISSSEITRSSSNPAINTVLI